MNQLEINKRRTQRLARSTATAFRTLKDAESVVNDIIDDIWDMQGEPGFESYRTGRLASLSSQLNEIFIGRDNQMKIDTRISYNLSRGEAAYETDAILQMPMDTWRVTEGQRESAWNTRYNKLADERKLQATRGAQIQRLVSDILETSNIPDYKAKDAKHRTSVLLGTRTRAGDMQSAVQRGVLSGRYVPTNGVFAETYRVARTEMHKINSIADADNMKLVQDEGADLRLMKRGGPDSRSREQSNLMKNEINQLGRKGQISDKDGKFYYYDNDPKHTPGRYEMGEQPGYWAINDKGYTVQVVLSETDELEQRRKEYQESGQPRRFRTYRQWAEFNNIQMEEFIPAAGRELI